MSVHVKAAASSMLPKIQKVHGDNVIVSRINYDTDLDMVKSKIKELYNILVKEQMIKDVHPTLCLGSTRLIAPELDGAFLPAPIETSEMYKKAQQLKDTYGDIDIDVEMLTSPKEVGECLKHAFPEGDIAYKLCGNTEVNVAVVFKQFDPIRVLQFDFVDISKNRVGIIYNQYSSWLDMCNNLKGLVREIIATTVAKTHPVSDNLLTEVSNLLSTNKHFIYDTLKAKEEDQLILKEVRWSLGHEFLKLIAVYTKIKNGKELKTPQLLPLITLPQIETISHPPVVMYDNNMDYIAQAIGFSSGEVMFHSILMLQEIKAFNLNRKQLIWDGIIKALDRKRPTETAGGQMSNEEADKTIEILKPYFEGVQYDKADA